MSLDKYNSKRDFKQTAEPKGDKAPAEGNLRFVIQRHQASQLHYDFRLEMEGVLKSWAVPKGPSLNPKQKRLAMMVEDHPLDYRTFEGSIPEGNYGAGIVEIWDEGTFVPAFPEGEGPEEEQLLEGLERGDLKFSLQGKKLKGEFALVKTKGMGKNAWLLIKHRDEFAIDEDYSAEDHISPDSQIPKGGIKR